ncbi:hypothetical protein [Ktedonospora formicarum]|uniref:hypothetical protein n=1 Tax=Ktedonospora formicarum TaxID=2778364 RepID=UPI001C68DAC0|nr:hypothetical protein [Ktedonospora formicarum]
MVVFIEFAHHLRRPAIDLYNGVLAWTGGNYTLPHSLPSRILLSLYHLPACSCMALRAIVLAIWLILVIFAGLVIQFPVDIVQLL